MEGDPESASLRTFTNPAPISCARPAMMEAASSRFGLFAGC